MVDRSSRAEQRSRQVNPTAERCVDAPIGRLRITARAGAIERIGFAVAGTPANRIGRDEPRSAEDASVLDAAAEQLSRYFDANFSAFTVPLAPSGTPFQLRCWEALRRVPMGRTTTYAELARGLGCPGGARAVGLAMNRNPIMIMIPCHRVLGSDGSLTGYAGGLDAKRALLDLESGTLSTLFARA